MNTTIVSTNVKLKDLGKALSTIFLEREKEIEGLLLALLSKQNVLLIGLPGTAKSALISTLAKSFDGAEYFQWLLTQFTNPEELFGALSFQELEKGVYKRNTENKLPRAHIAFLDEIFKANSAILNALLTLINERIFYNNGGVEHVPLQSLIGASNEYPEADEGLEALFDRFLVRFELGYLNEANNFKNMLRGNTNVNLPKISMAELQFAQLAVNAVQVDDAIFDKLVEIREALANEGIFPSDRRFKQSISLLKAKAYMEGRNDVQVSDVAVLVNSLWESPEQAQKARDIVQDLSIDTVTRSLGTYTKEYQEIQANFEKELKDANSNMAVIGGLVTEANAKLNSIIKEAKGLLKLHANREAEINVFVAGVQAITRKNAEATIDI